VDENEGNTIESFRDQGARGGPQGDGSKMGRRGRKEGERSKMYCLFAMDEPSTLPSIYIYIYIYIYIFIYMLDGDLRDKSLIS
jgi:hypothetical protein